MLLAVEPHAGLRPLLGIVREARRRLDIEVYELTDTALLDAIRQAVRRGVRVRVILDRTPWGTPRWRIVREAERVRATGAALRWSPARFERFPGHVAFDHAKFLCTPHVCELGTANFGWDAFHRNREYLLVTRRPDVVAALCRVFRADWTGERAGTAAHRVLVLSPGTSQSALLRVLRQPGPLDVESEELGAERAVLRALARRGRAVRLLLPANLSRADRRHARRLAARGVCVRLLPTHPLYLHAKMIVGPSLGFVGSENFTTTSLWRNREVGLLLRGPLLGRLRATFVQDWRRARPLAPCR